MKDGFTPVTGAAAGVPTVGVGMLGYAFMGKAHTNAFKKLSYMMSPPPALPELVAVCGRDAAAAAEAARRYGYAGYYTDWRRMVADERIQLFDNGGTNDVHAEPCIAAAEAGKHILCEKPLARTAEEAKRMLDAADRAGVKHMVGFNCRFIPAIRQARQLVESGALGRIYHFRAAYLSEAFLPHMGRPYVWRMDRERAGSGVLGDLGSHIVDLAHYLVGAITSVGAVTRTFISERPLPDGSGTGKILVDDAFVATVAFANGAIGTLEATKLAAGHLNSQWLEINGENGSIRFNLERLNELEVNWTGESPRETRGFHTVSVTEPFHPWGAHWWPRGHGLGWEHSFVHEMAHLLDCIAHDKPVGPVGATFADGYRAALVCDAIAESARSRRQIDIP